jgi:hypothetical protein
LSGQRPTRKNEGEKYQPRERSSEGIEDWKIPG